jgi:3-isopropylmalate/(R)-2-methylmalate dehydratase small subunit
MQAFVEHTGIVVAMDRANVDTDQIIPKQFLKRIERTGFGQFLFYDWRYRDGKEPNPEFELNRPEVAGASILLARQNFGSGSSREHAVWALADYGFRAILAPSFADIFYNNCFKNGLLPVVLDPGEVDTLFVRAGREPGFQLTVDLQTCQVRDAQGWAVAFSIEPSRRERLLNGWDDISMTLRHEDRIAQYERRHGIGA